jgi:D-alanine-D-alanine ligase
MDKWLTKLVADSVGVRTAAGVVVRRVDQAWWPGPCVVKPVRAGSSHGVSLVRTPDGLAAAVETALALDDRALVEELVTGREVDVAVLDLPGGRRVVGPALEIVTAGVFGLTEKYDGSADFRVPAALTVDERDALAEAALLLFDALGCRGLARVDFFLTPAGPVLNEVNTMPGLTPQSQLPRMMAAAGHPYPDLLDLLVQVAVEQHAHRRAPAVVA